MGSKAEKVLLMLFLVLALVASSVEAKTITLYRIQLGAYNTQAEAQVKEASAEAEGFSPVYIVQKDGETPWKVLVGDWAEYAQAKQQSVAWKAEGKNEGRGFVTQVDVPEESARTEALPLPKSALDTAIEQIKSDSGAAGAAKRASASYRLQVGNPSDLKDMEKLRAMLWAKGKSPVYIKCDAGGCVLLVGDYQTPQKPIADAAEFSSFGECVMVAANPSDKLLDVTEPRSEDDLYAALMQEGSPNGQEYQWANIDAGLQLLTKYPDTKYAPEAHLKMGLKLGQLSWVHRYDLADDFIVRLLRSEMEHLEAAIKSHTDPEAVANAKYRLGLAHQRMSKFGLNLEELKKSEALMAEASGSLNPEQDLNSIAFLFERAQTDKSLLPDVEERLNQFLKNRSEESAKCRAKAKLILAEVKGAQKDDDAFRSCLENLMSEELSEEARSARFFGMFMLANQCYLDKKDYDKALPIFQEIVANCGDSENIEGAGTRCLALNRLGVCLMEMGRLDEAKAAFEEHLAKYPEKGMQTFVNRQLDTIRQRMEGGQQ